MCRRSIFRTSSKTSNSTHHRVKAGKPNKAGFLLTVLGACAAPEEPFCAIAFSESGDVRVFAVSHQISLEEVETYESFAQSIRSRFEAEVAPCLATGRENLIVYPEDILLSAVAIGSRGTEARLAKTSLQAFGSLFGTYSGPFKYFRDRYPDVSAARQLLLALTDTVWRASEVFPELAADYGVWLMATGNMADATSSQDPELISLLSDPDLPKGPVYLPESADVWNQTLLWNPQGERIAQRRKVYLTSKEIDLLNLSWGDPQDLTPIQTPFANIGVIISMDAWMPDVIDRLAMDGANQLVQPEAFAGWAIPEVSEKEWLPDVMKESSFNAVQKHAEFRAAAVPMLVGNLLDLVFDGQGHIVKDAQPYDQPQGFIGQDGDLGFSQVGTWVESNAQTREELREVGRSLLPDGAHENEYMAGTVAADVELSELQSADVQDDSSEVADCVARPQISLDANDVYIACETETGVALMRDREIVREEDGHTPALAGSQMAWIDSDGSLHIMDSMIASDYAAKPDLAISPDGTLWVSWIAFDKGHTRVFVAQGPDFEPRRLNVRKPTFPNPLENEWAPAIATSGQRVAVCFAAFYNFSWDVYLQESQDQGETFSKPQRIDDGDNTFERLHADCEIAFEPQGRLWAAWTDLSSRRPDTTVRFGVEPFKKLQNSPAEEGSLDSRPTLVIFPNDVGLLWQELRSGTQDWVFATQSGTQLITELLAGDQWSPHAIANENGVLHVAWEDSRTGTRHVRTRSIP